MNYRARLVVEGFTQRYEETFSLVTRHCTIKLLLALSVHLDLDVIHLDVKTAFLNGDLSETVYIYEKNRLVLFALEAKT